MKAVSTLRRSGGRVLALLVVAGCAAAVSASVAQSAPVAHPSVRALPRSAPTFQPTSSETSYVPITPCRIVDTRVFNHPLANNAVRAYYVTGTTGFDAQGGRSGGCGIPSGVVAVAASMVAVGAHAAGIMRMWPTGQAEPNATAIVYPKTAKVGASGTLSINSADPVALRVKNYGGLVNLAIDVSGYYVKPLAGMISSGGTPYSGSSRIVSASRASAGVYDVQFDRDIRYCAAVASVYVSGYYASTTTFYGSDPHSVRVYLYNSGGASVDQYFYLNVEC